MRLAINCRSILKPRLTGIGRNTFHLLESLGRVDPHNQYQLYCPKRLFDFKRHLPVFNYPNFSIRTDALGRGAKVLMPHDVYHIPSPDQVPDHPVPVVVTVHDLIYKTYPQSHTAQTIDLTAQYMASIVAKAAKIICTSESTRRDLHRFLDVPQAKSCVVYNGVDHGLFFSLSGQERVKAAEMVKAKGIEGPYILSVGTIEPRKNLPNVLKALAHLKQTKQFQGKLVVIGTSGWMMEKIEPLIAQLGIQADVIFLGYVSDEELRDFYNLADVFVYPSFYEGFGFPIIEAFCCGCPVVTSNISSCPEIAGDAALTVDPNNAEAIAQAIASILHDQGLKEGLKAKALAQAQKFSFIKTAQETLKVYQSFEV